MKLHHQVVGSINYLAQSLPMDPGLNVKMGASGWTPDFHDQLAMAYQIEAVQHPMAAIERGLSGDAHPAAIDALWACAPATMQELGQELSLNMSNMTYELANAYSQIFRTPMSPLDQPETVLQIQAMFLPQNPAAPSTGASGPPGRPPAVRNEVAGSSVSKLIAQ